MVHKPMRGVRPSCHIPPLSLSLSLSPPLKSDSARSIFRLVDIGCTLFSAERTEHGRVEHGVLELVRALIDCCGPSGFLDFISKTTRDLLGFRLPLS